jgi:hypothetical protein
MCFLLPYFFSISIFKSNTFFISGELQYCILPLALISPFNYQDKNKFSTYLAGLIEGDGTIIVPAKNITSYRPYFEIVFHINDLPLCETIKLMIGGIIIIKKNYCILIIKRKLDVLKVITLINGNMRTPKIEALNRMINWWNLHYLTKIILLPLDNSPIQSNNWLTGLIDADGSFYFNWGIGKKGMPINLQYYMRVSQKMNYLKENNLFDISYFSIMNKIAKFLNVPLRYIIRHRQNNYIEKAYEVRSGSYISNFILLSYLIKYPLLSYKYKEMFVQLELLKITENKSYKFEDGLKILTNLKLKSKGTVISPEILIKDHFNHINKNFPFK